MSFVITLWICQKLQSIYFVFPGFSLLDKRPERFLRIHFVHHALVVCHGTLPSFLLSPKLVFLKKRNVGDINMFVCDNVVYFLCNLTNKYAYLCRWTLLFCLLCWHQCFFFESHLNALLEIKMCFKVINLSAKQIPLYSVM